MRSPNLMNTTSLSRHGVAALALVRGNSYLRPFGFDGEGADGGDGGDGNKPKFDPNDPAIKALIDEATKGLRNNRDQVLTESKQRGDQLKELMGIVGGDEGLKKLRELREKAEKDEEAKLLAEGKHDVWFERKTAMMRDNQRREIEAKDKALSDLEARATAAENELVNYKTSQRLISAADEAGVKPEYRDMLITFARNRVKLVKAEDGADVYEVYAEDGRTKAFGAKAAPMTPTELFETFRDKHKDLFLPSSGSGAGGGNKSGFAGKNPWDPKSHNATEQTLLFRQNPELARRLAAEHGVNLG